MWRPSIIMHIKKLRNSIWHISSICIKKLKPYQTVIFHHLSIFDYSGYLLLHFKQLYDYFSFFYTFSEWLAVWFSLESCTCNLLWDSRGPGDLGWMSKKAYTHGEQWKLVVDQELSGTSSGVTVFSLSRWPELLTWLLGFERQLLKSAHYRRCNWKLQEITIMPQKLHDALSTISYYPSNHRVCTESMD
jgi:hypothetical protein